MHDPQGILDTDTCLVPILRLLITLRVWKCMINFWSDIFLASNWPGVHNKMVGECRLHHSRLLNFISCSFAVYFILSLRSTIYQKRWGSWKRPWTACPSSHIRQAARKADSRASKSILSNSRSSSCSTNWLWVEGFSYFSNL